MLGLSLGDLIRAILFLFFANLTALVAAVTGPTYDHLLVPELGTGALYPSLAASASDPTNFLAAAARFSTFTIANVVDPAITLVALGVAVSYLAKPLVARWAATLDGLLPRLVLAVVAANFTVPIAGAILGLGGALYPVFAGWDGGAWQQWVHLAGWGEYTFSWDNGVVAFVLAIVQFAVVFALVLAVGVRDAVLAVLLVLLPLVSLLWPIRPLAPLARRAWLLFGELVFLPCVLVVPLELAVGSPNPVMLVAFLGTAVASPYFLSLAGTQLVAFGFPGSGSTIHPGVQRGWGAASSAAVGPAKPAAASAARSSPTIGRAFAGATRAAGSAAVPVAAPLAAVELVGHGALHLVRHLSHRASGSGAPPGRFDPGPRGGTK